MSATTNEIPKCYKICGICLKKVADCTCPSQHEINPMCEILKKERGPLKKAWKRREPEEPPDRGDLDGRD